MTKEEVLNAAEKFGVSKNMRSVLEQVWIEGVLAERTRILEGVEKMEYQSYSGNARYGFELSKKRVISILNNPK